MTFKDDLIAKYINAADARKVSISLSHEEKQKIRNIALSQNAPKDATIIECVYWIIHGITEKPVFTCKECKKTITIKSKFGSLNAGYVHRDFCSIKCSSKNKDIQQKREQTNLLRRGHTNNLWGRDVRNKIKQGWIEKYGVDNPFKLRHIREKTKKTNLANLGVEYPAQSPEVRQKYKLTMIERYGVDNSFKTGAAQRTNLERYGVENPMQHPDIFEKANRFRTKMSSFPSGKTYKYQGYENIAITSLLNTYNEDEIIIGRSIEIPLITYFNPMKNRLCYYFPDIFVPKDKLLIEVKSAYTATKRTEENLAKHLASIHCGFRHETWICSNKEVIEILL